MAMAMCIYGTLFVLVCQSVHKMILAEKTRKRKQLTFHHFRPTHADIKLTFVSCLNLSLNPTQEMAEPISLHQSPFFNKLAEIRRCESRLSSGSKKFGSSTPLPRTNFLAELDHSQKKKISDFLLPHPTPPHPTPVTPQIRSLWII